MDGPSTSAHDLVPVDRAPSAPGPAGRSWWWLGAVATIHVVVFGPVAYRGLYQTDDWVGSNLFPTHAAFAPHAFDAIWRPATPGYLWQATARLFGLPFGEDLRPGALLATLVFYALFGVAIFELYQRAPSGGPLLGPGAALGASVGLALLEVPAALSGWANTDERLFLPLYLPYSATTIGSLGLNVLVLWFVGDLVGGRLPDRRRKVLVALVVLAIVAKPTLMPLLVVAALVVSVIDDRRRRQGRSVAGSGRGPVLSDVVRLVVLPAAAITVLQFVTTVYKVQYEGVFDGRGGWRWDPLVELRALDGLTPYFWLGLLFPLVAVLVVRGPLWEDQSVRLATIGIIVGIIASLLLTRSGTVYKGDVVQLPEAAMAMLVVFIPRRLLELRRINRLPVWAAAACLLALLPYVIAGAMSWSCHVGLGCHAIELVAPGSPAPLSAG